MKVTIRVVSVVRLFGIAALTVLAGACSDHNAPTGVIDPRATQIRNALIISGPLTPTYSVASATSVADSQLIYVSLPPKSITGMDSVRIQATSTNGATTASAPMVDGGFDPIPVYGHVGDSIPITAYAGASAVGPVRFNVPMVRRPGVLRTTPPRGRTDVPLNQMIVVVFTQPVNTTSVTPASLRVTSGGVPVTGSLSILPAQPWVVRFTPDALLAPFTAYDIEVDTTITDAGGQVLSSPVSVPFTTGQSSASVASIAVYALGGGYGRRPSSVAIATTGAMVAFTAYEVSSTGDTLTAGSGDPISWSSGDPTVATIDNAGVATAVGAGSANLSACSSAICGVGTIRVDTVVPGVPPIQIGQLGYDTRVYDMAGGFVTGIARFAPDQTGQPHYHAFLWTASHGMEDLNTLIGESADVNSYADAVNAQGTVYVNGWLWNRSSGKSVAPLPDATHTWATVGMNATGGLMYASDSGLLIAYMSAQTGTHISPAPLVGGWPAAYVTDQGHVVVSTSVYDANRVYLGCGTVSVVFDAIAGQVISRLEPKDPVTGQPLPICTNNINNSDVVIGAVNWPANETAFRWSPGTGFTYLPSQGAGISSRAIMINAAGDATVYLISYRHVGADSLFEGRSAVWLASGRLIPLGGLGGTHTFANGINDSHLVTGHSQVGSDTGPQQAVVWNITGADVGGAASASVLIDHPRGGRRPPVPSRPSVFPPVSRPPQ